MFLINSKSVNLEITAKIVIPSRLDTEIGGLLRDAVPEKHKHLLRNFDLSNHREAMTILQQEFGKSGHHML